MQYVYMHVYRRVKPWRPPDDGGPLSLSSVHILFALADGPRHGYAIKQDVLAAWLPAARAIRIDPVEALRYE